MTDKVKLSKMSGKLEGITGINTNPLNNDYCKANNNTIHKNHICKHCYSCYMLNTFRKSCINAFQHNNDILSMEQSDLSFIPRIKTELCRIHAHGELINDNHLINLIRICRANQDTIFTLFTKRLDIVNHTIEWMGKPKNLVIVFSNPIIDMPIMSFDKYIYRYIDKIFNVVTKLNGILLIDDNIRFCKGKKCNNCRECYNHDKRIIFEELRVKPNINKTK